MKEPKFKKGQLVIYMHYSSYHLSGSANDFSINITTSIVLEEPIKCSNKWLPRLSGGIHETWSYKLLVGEKIEQIHEEKLCSLSDYQRLVERTQDPSFLKKLF